MARPKTSNDRALKELRDFGLRYPGAHTKSPWPGHLDLAVNDKTFAYLSIDGEPFKISCKLPESCEMALMLPHAKPTGYGLGKSGWVTVNMPVGEAVPVEMFKAWIDESYRAQAPKKLVASLDAERVTSSRTSVKKTPAKKTPAKKTPTTKSPATPSRPKTSSATRAAPRRVRTTRAKAS